MSGTTEVLGVRQNVMWLSSFLALLLFPAKSQCERKIFVEVPPDYSVNEPPSTPVEVTLNFEIIEVVNVDDKQNELELEGELTFTWTDQRIIFNVSDTGQVSKPSDFILDLDYRDKLWTPDLWIESLRHFEVHRSLDDQATLTVNANKTLTWWQSVSITTSCPMNFNDYPFDRQICRLRFSANGLDVSKQIFYGRIDILDRTHYSQGALQYSDFVIYHDKNVSFSSTSGKEWPQVHAAFVLTRRKLDHILQTFQPSGCLVCLSWISFLIPPYIVPGRMVLLVTLLLVVFQTYQNEHQQSPRSSDLKALDIWFVGSMIFVLAAIGHYAILLFLKRVFIKRRRRQDHEKENSYGNDKTHSQSKEDDRTLKFGDAINVRFANSSVRIPRSAVTPRYRSANTLNRISVHPVTSTKRDNQADGDKEGKTEMGIVKTWSDLCKGVLDSGSEYGDINETDLEGEEFLERIDDRALMIFPCFFLVFNIAYWCRYLFRDTISEELESWR